MTYYRVRKEFDQARKHPTRSGIGDFLIAHELYTEAERKELSTVPNEAFEQVQIPKHQTYWFFGARFQKQQSRWRNTPMLEGGI